jgi:L-fuconolactonase
VADLARRPNVVCKLSGLVTEAGPAWTLEQIAPYVDHLLDTFGPDRLLFGSDWPVCTVRAGYADVVELARSLLAERLSADERAKVMWANAQETYGLDVRRP